MIVHLNAWIVLSKFIRQWSVGVKKGKKEGRGKKRTDRSKSHLSTTYSFRHWLTKQHYHPQLPTLTHQTTLTTPVSVPPTASDTDSPNNTHITSLYHPQFPTLTHQTTLPPELPTLTHQTTLTTPVSVPSTASDTDSPNSTHITSLCTTHSFPHWLTKQHSHHQSLYHPQLPTLTHQTALTSPVSVPPTASDTDSPNNT